MNINGTTGNIGGIAAGQDMIGVTVGDISGVVTNNIGKLQDSDVPEAPKLAELLKQLQAAIEAEPNLTLEDKAEALEQVKAIAEAGQNPKEGVMQKTAKTAMRILKGIFSELPNVSKLVEESAKLLPIIAKIFTLSI
ncbi:MAG: hypothetical protein KME30_13100 [Iphinoe sp. HA4291-MV1]|nr:hypothetical protein [Iphinoe sp. HA4291-MV1]